MGADLDVVHSSYEKHWYAPHFTQKYHFTANDEQATALWNLLEEFSARTCPAPGQIVGVGSFGAKVIFVEHEHSEQAKNISRDLMTLLKSLDWMTWTDVDDHQSGPKLHSTIVKDSAGRTQISDSKIWIAKSQRAESGFPQS